MLPAIQKICAINLILIVMCGCVCGSKTTATSHNKRRAANVASVPTTTAPTSATSKLPMAYCGNTQKMVDECFKDLPPHLMEFLQNTKIAINEAEVMSRCNVFNRGMKCFDEYTARCLSNETLIMFNNNIEGAKRFFRKFCTDRDFQKDYLRHKDCFTHIQDDWIRCTNLFQNILMEELHGKQKNITNKFFEFCCARQAYETCIYKSARYKCYKNSAKFAHDTAKTLSEEKHFTNCRQFEKALCNAAAVGHKQRHSRNFATLFGLTLISMHYLLLMCVKYI